MATENKTSLPKLYYDLSSKRGILLKDLRAFEKKATKFAKKEQDIRFWERCLDLQLCPEYLKFRPPKVKQYANCNRMYTEIVKEKVAWHSKS